MRISSFVIFFLVVLFVNCNSRSVNIVDEIDDTNIDDNSNLNAKPNILFIIADDVSKDAIPNYSEGITKATMPNLQGLMNTGITFDNTWAYSVCSPTRASIITGKYGIKTNVIQVDDPISTSEISLQEYINSNTDNAYATALIGKWHLSRTASDPITMGIDFYAGILGGGVGDYSRWPLVENEESITNTAYATSKLTDLGIDWISDQTKPWFLWMAYNAPHTPLHLAPTDLHSQGNLPTDEASIDANPLPYYLSALEALDSEMGRLINSMSAEQKANTVIIFVGDNGAPNTVVQSPYTRRKAKGSLYQGGINVPMVVSGKGISRLGVRESALINTTDFFATIGNIAGATTSKINNSKSFYNLFSDENATKREYAYSEKEDAYTIRNSIYKYIKFDNGTEEFYNLNTDAYETSNLINGSLSAEESSAKALMVAEADRIRN